MEIVPAKAVARGMESGDEPRDGGQESVVVEKRGGHAAYCKWTIAQFGKVKQRSLWSRYFEVGGYDCRLLVYPKGDSQALPGYVSIYLQVCDPRGNSARWDCFASYRLCVVNCADPSKSIQRDSWHRFSGKKKSHGWCDFAQASVLVDPNQGFFVNDAVLISAEILVLHESVSFSRDNELALSVGPTPEVLSGKFTWKVHNLSLFKEMIKTQKIMSPVFPAGECNLRLSVYQSSVGGVDYLSMCLESKDTEKSGQIERSCWCLFRMSVLNQKTGGSHMHRDSYGRFAADNKSGDNTSLGWNDYMRMTDFLTTESGFLVEDTAVFSASFHIIKESSSFSKNLSPGFAGGRVSGSKKSDGFQGKFLWRIENFTKLKDLLKKRKITGLCIKSRRFQVGNRDCRLIVYPRGQSQPPMHLSMFLEVTDPRSAGIDWSCFVSHRLSVVNQKFDDRSVNKESQNRYSKAAKDWGWREFITLTALFDQDSGFLVNDTVVFSAEVLILKETAIASEPPPDLALPAPASWEGNRQAMLGSYRGLFTWRVENFLAFKEIMETRKIFSKFFQAGGVELRIGVYESFDTLCIYLESDAATVAADLDRNYWVRYRIAVMNQKHPERTVWKESSICTRTWNNSVLQFMKVSDMLDPDAGFVVREAVVFTCEVLDCCPWMEFADLEVFLSDDEQDDALSTDPDDFLDSDDSEDGFEGDDEDLFRTLLARAGFHLGSYSDGPPALLLDPMQLQVALQERLLMDPSSVGAFLTGLRLYLDEPGKLKRLLMPTKLPGMMGKRQGNMGEYSHSFTTPSLIDLLMGVKVLQPDILDLLLDIMVVCCTPQPGKEFEGAYAAAINEGREESDGAWPFWVDQRGQSSGEPAPHQRQRAANEAEAPQHARFESGVVDERFTVRGDSECVRSDAARGEMTSSSSSPGPPVLNSGLKQSSPSPAQQTAPQQSSVESVTPDDVSESSSDPSHPVSASELDADALHAPPEPDSGSGPLPSHPPLPQPGGADSHHHKRSSWQDESEELLGLIVNALRQLEGMMPHHAGLGDAQESAQRRPHSAQKVELVLERAPQHLLPDLIALAPKLVEREEHIAIAASLVARLSSPDTDLSLRLPLLASVSHLEVGHEAWEQVLAHGLELMQILNDDESLAATISFVLKAAADSGNLPAAAYAIRTKLKRLGPAIPPLVLDVIRSTVCLRADVAGALLHDIDADEERSIMESANGRAAAEAAQAAHSMMFGANESVEMMFAEDLSMFGDQQGAMAAAQATAAACWRIADVDILVEMLTVPALRLEAQRVFERAISRGVFGDQAVMVVLERRRSQRLILDLRLSVAPPLMGADGHAGAPPEDDDFPAVLLLAEALAASKDSRAREYVSTLYSIMFKVYGDESSRERMLRGIVERACSSCRDSGKPSAESDLGLDVLSFVVREEEGAARPALAMLRQTVESAHGERTTLARQLQSVEEELGKVKSNKAGEIQRLTKEKGELQAKLAEAEQAAQKAKAEAKTEGDRVRKDGKELAEKVRELEGQLEWVRSEREEEVQSLRGDKKGLEQRLREAEGQLAQIKSRKKDELKRVMKEKNVLAERLKAAETSRQKFDEEMKRFTSETVGKEELRKSLENEVRRLNSRMGQTETGLREKEEQILRCEAYIDGMEAKLHAHQDYIQTLEASLQEEMQRHAPLYGAGLEALSLNELSTLERIHDEGLKQVRALQQQKAAPSRPGSGHGQLPNGSAGPRPIGAELNGGGRSNGGGMSQAGGVGAIGQGGSLFGGNPRGGQSRAAASTRSMSPALPNGAVGNGPHMNGSHAGMNNWFQPA